LNLLRPGEQLFITEGCSDCWAMLSAGHKAIAIPSATLLTKQDVELLKHLGDSPSVIRSAAHSGDSPRYTFHMFPDRDAPGERLFLQLQQVLPSLVHHQLPPDCKDFSDYYLAHLRKTG
jgi:DNA primase